MHAPASYDYATVRLVPRVDREEFINVGVILFCLARDFLAARIEIDEARLSALSPKLDLALVVPHLEAIIRICEGTPGSGPIAELSRRERFHWLTAPRSTMIQVSPVHAGMSDSPQRALDDLFRQLVSLSGLDASG